MSRDYLPCKPYCDTFIPMDNYIIFLMKILTQKMICIFISIKLCAIYICAKMVYYI